MSEPEPAPTREDALPPEGDEVIETGIQPAKPFTAATLRTLEQASKSRFASLGTKIKTGCCSEIDEYLFSGGIERGIVLGMSGELELSRLISFHLLISVLLSTETEERGGGVGGRVVSIIDTTGSFPLGLLVRVLRSRLAQRGAGEGIEERITALLERISITRVFDMEGLWEVLHTEFSSTSKPEKESKAGNDGIQILLVEPLSTLIYTLFSHAERSAAHELLSSLSTHLHTLTAQKNILTILLNTSSSSPSSAQNKPTQGYKPIFASLPTQQKTPALGKLFTQFLDTHVVISGAFPKWRRDAEILYDSSSSVREKERVERVHVLEMALDLHLQREERWCAVEIEEGGESVRNAFPSSLPLGREGRGDREDEEQDDRMRSVGGVARIYGFGGRRV